jgi:hypothetical protein
MSETCNCEAAAKALSCCVGTETVITPDASVIHRHVCEPAAAEVVILAARIAELELAARRAVEQIGQPVGPRWEECTAWPWPAAKTLQSALAALGTQEVKQP